MPPPRLHDTAPAAGPSFSHRVPTGHHPPTRVYPLRLFEPVSFPHHNFGFFLPFMGQMMQQCMRNLGMIVTVQQMLGEGEREWARGTPSVVHAKKDATQPPSRPCLCALFLKVRVEHGLVAEPRVTHDAVDMQEQPGEAGRKVVEETGR